MVFFKNDRCVKCDHPLGFLPDVLEVSALETALGGWRACSPLAGGRIYRHCANEQQFHMCNWMVPENDPNPFCAACRLNKIIPDLTEKRNLERWGKLELAKRRCLYTLFKLGLPLDNLARSGHSVLAFQFLQDMENAPVKTGYQDGIITVNIAEADDDERERRRLTLHEPYRTVVGHLRHELGHLYWDLLVAESQHLKRFRELFGDETLDYEAALASYYKKGPAADWQEHNVTAYASSHPWEDWAETWAHYLHIVDTLDTALNFGVSVNPGNTPNNGAPKPAPILYSERMDFDSMLADWIPLTCALNTLNRGMGLSDLYPFVIPPAVVDKLRFIHQLAGKSA